MKLKHPAWDHLLIKFSSHFERASVNILFIYGFYGFLGFHCMLLSSYCIHFLKFISAKKIFILFAEVEPKSTWWNLSTFLLKFWTRSILRPTNNHKCLWIYQPRPYAVSILQVRSSHSWVFSVEMISHENCSNNNQKKRQLPLAFGSYRMIHICEWWWLARDRATVIRWVVRSNREVKKFIKLSKEIHPSFHPKRWWYKFPNRLMNNCLIGIAQPLRS